MVSLASYRISLRLLWYLHYSSSVITVFIGDSTGNLVSSVSHGGATYSPLSLPYPLVAQLVH